jgi:integrase/recombinase XerD
MEEIRLHQFAEKLDLLAYSPRSIKIYCDDVARFFKWLSEHEGLTSLDDVNERHLSAYHTHLQYGKTKKGDYLATTTLHHRLFAVKIFYRIMHQERLVKQDYAHLITPPRQKQRLPKNVPSELDVAAMLNSIEPTTLLGIRNRAMLELLYATGIRNMELRLLKLEDLNLSERTLFIHGKGAKDRLAPLGAWVVPYLMEYLEVVRPKLLRGKKCNLLFVTKSGNEIPAENLCYIVRTLAKNAGLTQRLNPHSMRHACATHMLRGGADIRFIQELLGHTELSTTQIYTHVDISMLKKAHHQYHPREKSVDNDPGKYPEGYGS